jgi:hypothetical protein
VKKRRAFTRRGLRAHALAMPLHDVVDDGQAPTLGSTLPSRSSPMSAAWRLKWRRIKSMSSGAGGSNVGRLSKPAG